MAIADHGISTRAISVPEEVAAPAVLDQLGTVVLVDKAAGLLELEDVGLWLETWDAPAGTLELADSVSGQVIISDGPTPLDVENAP